MCKDIINVMPVEAAERDRCHQKRARWAEIDREREIGRDAAHFVVVVVVVVCPYRALNVFKFTDMGPPSYPVVLSSFPSLC